MCKTKHKLGFRVCIASRASPREVKRDLAMLAAYHISECEGRTEVSAEELMLDWHLLGAPDVSIQALEERAFGWPCDIICRGQSSHYSL